MSRGFGTTFGVSTTDKILTQYTSNIGDTSFLRSYHAWAYQRSAGGGNLGRLWSKRTVSGTEVDSCYWAPTGASGSGSFNINYQIQRIGNSAWECTTPALNNWYSFVVTYDGSSTLNVPKMYLNGISQTVTQTAGPSGSIVPNADPFVIGNRASDNARIWDGMVAHFAIWNGVILSAADALNLANGANPMSIHQELLGTYLPLAGTANPELDLILGTSGTITGTKQGTSDPSNIQSYPPSSLNFNNYSSYFTPNNVFDWGFLPFGGIPPVPSALTGGHFIPKKHADDYRRELEKERRILQTRELEKLNSARSLRHQIEILINPPIIDVLSAAELPRETKEKRNTIITLENKLVDIEAELSFLKQEAILLALKDRMVREQDDIEAILMALN